MKNLHERAVEAAIRFVERKGYEVLDRNWSCEGIAGRLDLAAMDEDAIVFIDVTAANREEGGFSEGNLTREQFELLAATWLEGYTPRGRRPGPLRRHRHDRRQRRQGPAQAPHQQAGLVRGVHRVEADPRRPEGPQPAAPPSPCSQLAAAPRLRGTRPRAPGQPGPLHPSRHGFPTRLRRLRNAAWPFLRESPPKGATSRMGLRAPCPRPRGTPPWESHARPPSRTGSQRSGAAGLSRARPRLRRPHDIPAKPGEGPCGNRVWRRWRLSPS